ncbi:putative structural polyprotein [Beihai Nido-like virus 1]|uniref:Putative structural polyprotein n=1 Tax=Beihai Nido-like virus 1 TaxID=1922350 RepID=A0A1L3KIX6_9NIDO|nr:putative structural polyprotein [Beihai Nido-like virus 1]APG77324.1 putative structural polyprotein [Beihai Nido-like virus 1]
MQGAVSARNKTNTFNVRSNGEYFQVTVDSRLLDSKPRRFLADPARLKHEIGFGFFGDSRDESTRFLTAADAIRLRRHNQLFRKIMQEKRPGFTPQVPLSAVMDTDYDGDTSSLVEKYTSERQPSSPRAPSRVSPFLDSLICFTKNGKYVGSGGAVVVKYQGKETTAVITAGHVFNKSDSLHAGNAPTNSLRISGLSPISISQSAASDVVFLIDQRVTNFLITNKIPSLPFCPLRKDGLVRANLITCALIDKKPTPTRVVFNLLGNTYNQPTSSWEGMSGSPIVVAGQIIGVCVTSGTDESGENPNWSMAGVAFFKSGAPDRWINPSSKGAIRTCCSAPIRLTFLSCLLSTTHAFSVTKLLLPNACDTNLTIRMIDDILDVPHPLPDPWFIAVFTADAGGLDVNKWLAQHHLPFSLHGIWNNGINLTCCDCDESACQHEISRFISWADEFRDTYHWNIGSDHLYSHEYSKHGFSYGIDANGYRGFVHSANDYYSHNTWYPYSCRIHKGINYIQEAANIPNLGANGCDEDLVYSYNGHFVQLPFRLLYDYPSRVRAIYDHIIDGDYDAVGVQIIEPYHGNFFYLHVHPLINATDNQFPGIYLNDFGFRCGGHWRSPLSTPPMLLYTTSGLTNVCLQCTSYIAHTDGLVLAINTTHFTSCEVDSVKFFFIPQSTTRLVLFESDTYYNHTSYQFTDSDFGLLLHTVGRAETKRDSNGHVTHGYITGVLNPTEQNYALYYNDTVIFPLYIQVSGWPLFFNDINDASYPPSHTHHFHAIHKSAHHSSTHHTISHTSPNFTRSNLIPQVFHVFFLGSGGVFLPMDIVFNTPRHVFEVDFANTLPGPNHTIMYYGSVYINSSGVQHFKLFPSYSPIYIATIYCATRCCKVRYFSYSDYDDHLEQTCTGLYGPFTNFTAHGWISVEHVYGDVRGMSQGFHLSRHHTSYYITNLSKQPRIPCYLSHAFGFYGRLACRVDEFDGTFKPGESLYLHRDGVYFESVFLSTFYPSPVYSQHELLTHYHSDPSKTHCFERHFIIPTNNHSLQHFTFYPALASPDQQHLMPYPRNTNTNFTGTYNFSYLYASKFNLSPISHCTDPPNVTHIYDRSSNTLLIKAPGARIRVRRHLSESSPNGSVPYVVSFGELILDISDICPDADTDTCNVYFLVGNERRERIVRLYTNRCPIVPVLDDITPKLNDFIYWSCQHIVLFYLILISILLSSTLLIVTGIYACVRYVIWGSIKLCLRLSCCKRCRPKYTRLPVDESDKTSVPSSKSTIGLPLTLMLLFCNIQPADCFDLTTQHTRFQDGLVFYDAQLTHVSPARPGDTFAFDLHPKDSVNIVKPKRLRVRILDVGCHYDSIFQYWTSALDSGVHNAYTCCGRFRCDHDMPPEVRSRLNSGYRVFSTYQHNIFPCVWGYGKCFCCEGNNGCSYTYHAADNNWAYDNYGVFYDVRLNTHFVSVQVCLDTVCDNATLSHSTSPSVVVGGVTVTLENLLDVKCDYHGTYFLYNHDLYLIHAPAFGTVPSGRLGDLASRDIIHSRPKDLYVSPDITPLFPDQFNGFQEEMRDDGFNVFLDNIKDHNIHPIGGVYGGYTHINRTGRIGVSVHQRHLTAGSFSFTTTIKDVSFEIIRTQHHLEHLNLVRFSKSCYSCDYPTFLLLDYSSSGAGNIDYVCQPAICKSSYITVVEGRGNSSIEVFPDQRYNNVTVCFITSPPACVNATFTSLAPSIYTQPNNTRISSDGDAVDGDFWSFLDHLSLSDFLLFGSFFGYFVVVALGLVGYKIAGRLRCRRLNLSSLPLLSRLARRKFDNFESIEYEPVPTSA